MLHSSVCIGTPHSCSSSILGQLSSFFRKWNSYSYTLRTYRQSLTQKTLRSKSWADPFPKNENDSIGRRLHNLSAEFFFKMPCEYCLRYLRPLWTACAYLPVRFRVNHEWLQNFERYHSRFQRLSMYPISRLRLPRSVSARIEAQGIFCSPG